MMERKLYKYGNIYGDRFNGASFAGNVWSVDGLCPTIKTMSTGGSQQPMVLVDLHKERKINEVGHIEKGTGKHESNIVYCSGGLRQRQQQVWE